MKEWIGHFAIVKTPNDAHHPTEERKIKLGDKILISNIRDGFVVFDIDPKFGRQNIRFGYNKQAILLNNVELCQDWTGLINLTFLKKEGM